MNSKRDIYPAARNRASEYRRLEADPQMHDLVTAAMRGRATTPDIRILHGSHDTAVALTLQSDGTSIKVAWLGSGRVTRFGPSFDPRGDLVLLRCGECAVDLTDIGVVDYVRAALATIATRRRLTIDAKQLGRTV